MSLRKQVFELYFPPNIYFQKLTKSLHLTPQQAQLGNAFHVTNREEKLEREGEQCSF